MLAPMAEYAGSTFKPPRRANADQDSGVRSPADARRFALWASRGFPEWLARQGVSLAFTTYQVGSLFLMGLAPDGGLSVYERSFDRAMGFWTDGQTAWLAARLSLWRMENVLAAGTTDQGYDRLYVPRVGYTIGDLDVHDLAADARGLPVFVNTRFNCLATIHERNNFELLWKPPFISQLVPEDRCHLNGLAMVEGRPGYATACARSDVVDGWRDYRVGGGCVVDVGTGEIAATGLSMPHSPRMYRDQLWVLDSGTGYFGRVDLKRGRFEPVTFVPGYARGLAFCGDYAVIGVSGCRSNRTFQGLHLERTLRDKTAEARCGLQIVELATGAVAHSVRIEGVIHELYDVAVLPGVRRPKAMGFLSDEVAYRFWADDQGAVRHWDVVGAQAGDAPSGSGSANT
jgi:uncharacterized protein (TIGR03032 family)